MSPAFEHGREIAWRTIRAALEAVDPAAASGLLSRGAFVSPYLALGDLNMRFGRLHDAEKFYRRAVRLDAENPEALVGLGIPVLGYYSHVNTETKQAAEAAGIDLAVPRSRMARELPQLVDRLLADR